MIKRSLLALLIFITIVSETFAKTRRFKARKADYKPGDVYLKVNLEWIKKILHNYIEKNFLNTKVKVVESAKFVELTSMMSLSHIQLKLTSTEKAKDVVTASLYLPSFSVSAQLYEESSFDVNKIYNITFKSIEIGFEFDLSTKDPYSFLSKLTKVDVKISDSDFTTPDYLLGTLIDNMIKSRFSGEDLKAASANLFMLMMPKVYYLENDMIVLISNIKIGVSRDTRRIRHRNQVSHKKWPFSSDKKYEHNELLIAFTFSINSGSTFKELNLNTITNIGSKSKNSVDALIGLDVVHSITAEFLSNAIKERKGEFRFESLSEIGKDGTSTISMKKGNEIVRLDFKPQLGFSKNKISLVLSNLKANNESNASLANQAINTISSIKLSYELPVELFASNAKQTFIPGFLEIEIPNN